MEVQECWISFLSIEHSKLPGLQNISTALIKENGKKLFDYYLDKLGRKTAFLYNLNKKALKIFNIRDKFTQEIFEIWAELHFRPNQESFADFLEQDLWNNSLLRIDNSPVFFF